MKKRELFGRLAYSGLPAPTILCIDDEARILDCLRRQFARHGFETLTAFHGMQGVLKAGELRPDIILTDLQMPRGRGDDLILALKVNPKTARIPVIVLTGVQDPGVDSALVSKGAKAVLHKPVRFEHIVSCVKSHLEMTHRSANSAQ